MSHLLFNRLRQLKAQAAWVKILLIINFIALVYLGLHFPFGLQKKATASGQLISWQTLTPSIGIARLCPTDSFSNEENCLSAESRQMTATDSGQVLGASTEHQVIVPLNLSKSLNIRIGSRLFQLDLNKLLGETN